MDNKIIVSGIYLIKNKKTKKVYVGSSKNIEKRWYSHKKDLNNNKHSNKYLQNSWNKTKDKSIFEFSIIEEVKDIAKLFEREQYWIDFYQAYKHDFGYNIADKAGEVPKVIQREIEQKKKKKDNFDNKLNLVYTLKNDFLNKLLNYKNVYIEIEVVEHIAPSVKYINQQVLLFTYCTDMLCCMYDEYIKYHPDNNYTFKLSLSGCSNHNHARYYLYENGNCIVVISVSEIMNIKEMFNFDNNSAIKFLVFGKNAFGLSLLKGITILHN